MAGEEAEAGLFHLLNGAGSNPALDAVALLLDISAALYVIIWWAAQLWVVKKRSLAFDYLVALLITVAVTEGLKFAIGRWLSPGPGARSGSSSQSGPGPW